jgi:hypothetical protein
VQERIAEWTKLLSIMKTNPEGDEFVYLKQAWPDALPLNPFDLQVGGAARDHEIKPA